MIDSVHLRIHDLEVHKRLVDYLYRPHSSGTELLHVEMTEDEKEFIKKQQVFHGRLFRDFTTGKMSRMAYRDWIRSSHYDIAFAIRGDEIEFNFSIPKYLYGTNVFQFIPHRWDKNYHDFVSMDKKRVREVSYKRLFAFIQFFFDKHLQGFVDWRLVELTQIDLTFVKIFPSKDYALYYLNELKRITKKRWKDSRNIITNYSGGIWFKTEDYLFKCYHKGSEFQVHDRKQLERLRKKDVLTQADIGKIQEIADCMVRYEMAFKPAYMNKIYKKKNGVLGYDPLLLKRALSLKKSGYIKVGGKKYFPRDLKAAEKITYDKIYKAWNRTYAIKIHPEVSKKEIFLEEDLFMSMMRVFGVMVNYHSVKWSGEYSHYVGMSKEQFLATLESKLIQKYGGEKGAKLVREVSYSKLKQILKVMETSTLKELWQDGWLSRTVYFRYQKILEVLGVGQAVTAEQTREPENHFREYYILVNEKASGINLYWKKSVV